MLLAQFALLTLTAYTRFVFANSYPHLLRHHRHPHQSSQVEDTSNHRQVFLLPSSTTTAEPTTERPQRTSIPRRKRHYRRHVCEDHPLSEQNSDIHRAQLNRQQLMLIISQMARKTLRAANTELPSIPGQTEEQRQRLRNDDAHVVADDGGQQNSPCSPLLVQQNFPAAQQLDVLNQILREWSRSNNRLFS
jgi:hypothetical protein